MREDHAAGSGAWARSGITDALTRVDARQRFSRSVDALRALFSGLWAWEPVLRTGGLGRE